MRKDELKNINLKILTWHAELDKDIELDDAEGTLRIGWVIIITRGP